MVKSPALASDFCLHVRKPLLKTNDGKGRTEIILQPRYNNESIAIDMKTTQVRNSRKKWEQKKYIKEQANMS